MQTVWLWVRGEMTLDLGMGEHSLAYATLVNEAYHSRLTGEDAVRGYILYVHRSAILHDQ